MTQWDPMWYQWIQVRIIGRHILSSSPGANDFHTTKSRVRRLVAVVTRVSCLSTYVQGSGSIENLSVLDWDALRGTSSSSSTP